MNFFSLISEFVRRQAPEVVPQHIVLVADGTGKTHFQHDYALFPARLLQHVLTFAFFKIPYLSIILYGLFSPNISSESRTKNCELMRGALTDLLIHLEGSEMLVYIVVYGSFYQSRPDSAFLECLELMGRINDVSRKRRAEHPKKQLEEVTLSIFACYSSLAALHSASARLCQGGSSFGMDNGKHPETPIKDTKKAPIDTAAITNMLSSNDIEPYVGISGDIHSQKMDKLDLSKRHTRPLPPPDIFARTSGEERIGDYFLWELPLHRCMLVWNVYSLYKSPGPIRLLLLLFKWSSFNREMDELDIRLTKRTSRYAHLGTTKTPRSEKKAINAELRATGNPSIDGDIFDSVSIFADCMDASSVQSSRSESEVEIYREKNNVSRSCFVYE